MTAQIAENAVSAPPAALPGWWRPALAGLALFLLVLGAGSYTISLETDRQDRAQHADLLEFGSSLRIRINQELSSVLYLSSGLSSYMAVRSKNQDPQEINDILGRLYTQARHVRNFGIAVGTTLTYVFPLEGNQAAVGLRYDKLPAQWPGVKAVIDSGKPLLAGPVSLVQGGQGLIYRVPIFIQNRYWGLLSTVVDADALFRAAFANMDPEDFEFAIRGRDARGRSGAPIYGRAALFDMPDTEIVDVEVPGGAWALGLRITAKRANTRLLWQLRLLTWLLALVSGWYVYHLLRQRSQLAYIALHDPLTGLPNRRLLEDRLQQAIHQLQRQPERICGVLLFDLNGFKPINDQHGHKAGDMVLQQVAERVSQALRSVDTVGRWGGDEFVVVVQNTDRQKLPEVVRRVQDAVARPFAYGGNSLQVGASIGVAVVPDDGDSASELIRIADQRMYQNKRSRGGPAAA